MSFDEILTHVLDLLRRQGRLSYRALKARFQLDDDLLEALKDERIYAHYNRQAGARVASRSAYREAVAYFEQALAALEHLPEYRATLEQAIDLRLDLRNVLFPLDAHTRIFDQLRAAEPLAERLDDPRQFGWIASYLCISFSAMSEHGRAIAAGQRALALATTSGAFDVQVVALTYLGVAYYAAGDFRQALDVLRRVIALSTGEWHATRFGTPVLPAVVSRGYMAGSLAALGDFAEGRGVAEEAVRLAEAVEQPYSIAACLHLGYGICPGRARCGSPPTPQRGAGARGHRAPPAPPSCDT
jgi:tetratricopeptide (TPR) repeat protein